MRLYWQRLLGWFDRTISDLFWLTSMGDGPREGTSDWTFYSHDGPRIAIVGTDGRIHTLTGYYAVNHRYEDGKLVKRILARKDLKPGERLATDAEVFAYQCELSERFNHAHGFTCS